MTKAINNPFFEMEDFTWTAELYNELIDKGILTPDHKVELLDGVIIKKVAINEAHAACVDGLQEYFYDKFRKKFTLRSENPIRLDEESVPEPDFVICERREDRYKSAHPVPDQIKLVIEVADSTVDKDRNFKAVRYAKAGIQEYWIINVRDNQVEVYLEPNADSESYLSVNRYLAGASFESPFNGLTNVDEMLP
jgi:Uma2 family endonuclease